MKKQNIPEVSPKSTKEQILVAYNDVLSKLTEKQVVRPEEQKKQKEEETIVIKATAHTSDTILTDLSALKSKTIKQIDSLSEQLLDEFQKLANLREAITLEQKHLQELYQINEIANTLSALLQTQTEQKEKFKLEMEQIKEAFEQEMLIQKTNWQLQKEQIERDYKENKEKFEKSRKHEEEDYTYALALKRRNEMDGYNNKKAILEKELSDSKDSFLKREAELAEKEKSYESLKIQVEQIPDQIKAAVDIAEESLRNRMSQQYDFETKLKQKEYDGALKLEEQNINNLEDKVKKLEISVKELIEKADLATQNIQSIACRALDTSAGRFFTVSSNKPEEKAL
jgi:hypothetical protein